MSHLSRLLLVAPLALGAVACVPADVDGDDVGGEYSFGRAKTAYFIQDSGATFVVVSDYDIACEDYADAVYGLEDGDEFGIVYMLANGDTISDYAVVPGDDWASQTSPAVYIQMEFWSVTDDGTGNLVTQADVLEEAVSGVMTLDSIDAETATGTFYYTLPAGEEIEGDFEAEWCESLL